MKATYLNDGDWSLARTEFMKLEWTRI